MTDTSSQGRVVFVEGSAFGLPVNPTSETVTMADVVSENPSFES
jgi:hypothetical protein